MMKEDEFTSLPSLIDENFSALDSEIVTSLPEKDAEYAALIARENELDARFPLMETWLQGEGPLSLTAEERAGMVEYLELAAEKENIERRAIYYAGHRNCFAYLKKIGAI